jgi:heat shock protein 5
MSGSTAIRTLRRKTTVEKLKELEDVCNPVFSGAYQRSGGEDGTEANEHDEL